MDGVEYLKVDQKEVGLGKHIDQERYEVSGGEGERLWSDSDRTVVEQVE